MHEANITRPSVLTVAESPFELYFYNVIFFYVFDVVFLFCSGGTAVNEAFPR